MYNSHFGFREKPFKLVPNPEYLYLSKIHEIALAHLNYAVSQGDGFVVITGEVGTGKTTLCRIFLERLGEGIESAYIFNPKLDSVQLLTTICNEFGIRTNYGNLKQLLDVINGYLIMKNKEGRKVILLIDEAQNLSIENLEMVRMLSNLETTRNKLLQIILVGQPELGDKLDSYELRQLAQRISLSAHLTPLGADETAGYIHHRINIAAQRQISLFTRGACRQIFGYSRGIPRIINIACDRALLTAYSLNRPNVTTAIAKLAVEELTSRGRKQERLSLKWVALWSVVGMAVLILFGVMYSKTDFLRRPSSSDGALPAISAQEHTAPSADAAPPVNAVPLVDAAAPASGVRTYKIHEATNSASNTSSIAEPSFQAGNGPEQASAGSATQTVMAQAIAALDHENSRLDAVARILERWHQSTPNSAQLPALVDDFEYFDIAAHQYGLRMHIIRSDLALVKKLNLPAIVALKTNLPGEVVYMTLVGWTDGQIELSAGSGRKVIQTDLDTLLLHMYGPVYIYWKNVLNVDGIISTSSQPKDVRALKSLLLRLGYNQLDAEPVFDDGTQQTIMDFQIRHNLAPDGLVGPLTKIFLIKEAGLADFPLLNAKHGGSGA